MQNRYQRLANEASASGDKDMHVLSSPASV
jgi:hypothetical protein